jgi:ferredoxin/flavodoxin
MNKIYYFTGSGNTLAIAHRIADKLGNCELIKVTAKLDFSKLIDAEKLGFLFPVYAWGMPLLYKEFIEKLKISHADYVFVITNYAGDGGNVLVSFRSILEKKNISIDAFGEIKMPSNYVVMGNSASVKEAEVILKKAEPELEYLADSISEGIQISLRKVKLILKILTPPAYSMFSKNVRKTDKSFFTTESCTGCGICADVCPVENIILNIEKRPEWQHKCEQCHACFHWCPEHAIEFTKKTSHKNRYTHPDIKLKEMIIGNDM